MSELVENLYQELIIDHSKNPRNFHKLEGANRTAEGYNPLCGDYFKIYLKVDKNMIRGIGFEGSGCAISKASASLMTTSIKGKSVTQAKELFEQFHHLLAGDEAKVDKARLGKLAVFSGVRQYPVRVKCATLAWHALHAGLENDRKTVSTETISTEWEAG